MPRIRSIVPEFWEDERLARISPSALLLFIGMKNFADDQGVIVANEVLIRNKVFPVREDIRRQQVGGWLRELCENSVIVPFAYEGRGYFMMDFSSERIDKPQRSKIPQEVIDRVRRAERREETGMFGSVPAGEERRGTEEDGGEEAGAAHPPEEGPRREERRAGPEDPGKVCGRPDAGGGESGRPECGAADGIRGGEPGRFDRFCRWVERNAPRTARMAEPVTEGQFAELVAAFGAERVADIFLAMHNYQPLLRSNRSAYLTAKRWMERDTVKANGDGRDQTNGRRYGSTDEAKRRLLRELGELSAAARGAVPHGDGGGAGLLGAPDGGAAQEA